MKASQAPPPDQARSATPDAGPTSERSPLRLVRGEATPEEVAALLAVLSTASGGDRTPAPRHTSQWSSPERALRRPLNPAPGAWRASSWRS